jgi:hypothetical protein
MDQLNRAVVVALAVVTSTALGQESKPAAAAAFPDTVPGRCAKGVEPDVTVPADKALERALSDARSVLGAREGGAGRKPR